MSQTQADERGGGGGGEKEARKKQMQGAGQRKQAGEPKPADKTDRGLLFAAPKSEWGWNMKVNFIMKEAPRIFQEKSPNQIQTRL